MYVDQTRHNTITLSLNHFIKITCTIFPNECDDIILENNVRIPNKLMFFSLSIPLNHPRRFFDNCCRHKTSHISLHRSNIW